MDILETIDRIQSHPDVIGAYSLDPRTLYQVINEESARKSWLGMPLYNLAAKTCLSRKHTLCVFSKNFIEPLADGFIAITDDYGIEVGKYVGPEGKEAHMNNICNVWLTDDIVLFPYKMTNNPISVIMKAIEPTFLGDDYGASSASLFYPCEKTDLILKCRFGIDPDSMYSSAIIGLGNSPQQMVRSISAEYIRESF